MNTTTKLAAAITLLSAASLAHAEILGSSTFPTNPAPADPRFTYNADHTLTAHYNTGLATDKLAFPLTRSVTADDTFTIQTRFKILSTNFFAQTDAAAQISFGLINGITTGNDRSGGIGHSPVGQVPVDFGSSGDSFDSVSVDYFPNPSSLYHYPTISPAIITSQTTGEPAFWDLNTTFGPESELDGPGESPLPQDIFLNSTLSYSATTRILTFRLATDSAPLFINAGGGADADTTTIQTALAPGMNFNANQFALTLWTDSYADSGPSLIADVVFSSFSVSVPEPASLFFLSLGAAALLRRRR